MILSNVWHCCGRKNRKATKAAMQIAAAFAVHLINKIKRYVARLQTGRQWRGRWVGIPAEHEIFHILLVDGVFRSVVVFEPASDNKPIAILATCFNHIDGHASADDDREIAQNLLEFLHLLHRGGQASPFSRAYNCVAAGI